MTTFFLDLGKNTQHSIKYYGDSPAAAAILRYSGQKIQNLRPKCSQKPSSNVDHALD